MGWGPRIALGLGILVIAAAVGLAVYGGRVVPVRHPVEQVISNDRLPN